MGGWGGGGVGALRNSRSRKSSRGMAQYDWLLLLNLMTSPLSTILPVIDNGRVLPGRRHSDLRFTVALNTNCGGRPQSLKPYIRQPWKFSGLRNSEAF